MLLNCMADHLHSHPNQQTPVQCSCNEEEQLLSCTYASLKSINFAGERLDLSAVLIRFLLGLAQGIIVPVSSFREICKLQNPSVVSITLQQKW